MNPLKAILLEDDKAFRKELKGFLLSQSDVEIVFSASRGEDLIKIIDQIEAEVFFIDIGLPDLSGLEVARCVRDKWPESDIVFITSYREFAREAFEVYATDYLTKPFDQDRLLKTLNLIKKRSTTSHTLINFKTAQGQYILRENEIYFIEAQRKESIIYTRDKIITVNHLLNEITKMLKRQIFFRTSRSYLVNVQKIDSIRPSSRSSYQIHFKDIDGIAYLTKNRYSEFRQLIKKFFRSSN